jgi:hypothetical protein
MIERYENTCRERELAYSMIKFQVLDFSAYNILCVLEAQNGLT